MPSVSAELLIGAIVLTTLVLLPLVSLLIARVGAEISREVEAGPFARLS